MCLCVVACCRSNVSECGGWVCDRDKLRDKETEWGEVKRSRGETCEA